MQSTMELLFPLLFFGFLLSAATASENTPLEDTCPTEPSSPIFINGFLCKNPATVTPSDFKTSRLNHDGDTENFLRSSVNLVTAAEFPGLNSLGVSMARTDMAMDGMVLPHSHPRASEMVYVARGNVVVGFVDTKNRLFQKSLGEGDVFVVPRGLLHFCLNSGYGLATLYSTHDSQNPGVASISGAMFAEDSEVAERMVARMMELREMDKGNRNTTVVF